MRRKWSYGGALPAELLPEVTRMLTREENELLTQVGADRPMGRLFRSFWIPVLLAEELPEPDCPPVQVSVLGERLIAFRDSNGEIGLVDAYCAHRGANLFWGRAEQCGLRCVYHGWLYDVHGQCIDMPNEPAGSGFKERIRIPAYPAREAGGIIWGYLGLGLGQQATGSTRGGATASAQGLALPGFPQLEW